MPRVTIVPGVCEKERIDDLVKYCRQYKYDDVMFFLNAEDLNDGHIELNALEPYLQVILKAKSALKKAGINSALLNIGGNVQAVGRKPDGNKWIIGIRNPFDKGGLAGIIEAENTAVITSGGYERCFTGSDGRTYHHIIDPETGRPAESGLASVTVIAESGEYADSLSTALFVMGQGKAAAYWRNLGTAEPAKETDAGEKPFDMIIITNSGELFITEGVSGNFTPADDYTGSLTVLEK